MRRAALGCLLLVACGPTSPNLDAGFDGGRPDAGHDAGHDAGIDAGIDAGFDGGADAGSDAGLDAGSDAGTDAGLPNGSVLVVAPATHATANETFSLDITGQGMTDFGTVAVAADLATQQLYGASYGAFAYETQTFSGYPYQLFDLIAVEDGGSDLSVSYLYCGQPEDLSYIYSESVFHPLKYEVATGTCDAGFGNTAITVDLPAVNFTFVPFDTGITIDGGASVSLGPSGGTVMLPNGVHQVLPFETVDCSTCPGGPWFELHAIITSASEACFGILYVFPTDPTNIQLGYTVCLPSLNETVIEQFVGSWSGTLNTHPPRGPGLVGPMLPRPLPPRWR